VRAIWRRCRGHVIDSNRHIDTPIGPLTLRRATLDDVAAVLSIMVDAAQLPLTRGLDMWGWVGTPTGERIVRQRIEQDEVYLADRAGAGVGEGGSVGASAGGSVGAKVGARGESVATMCIQWSDPETWGDRGRDDAAGYVHGLAVLREFMGHGVGKALVEWAAHRIAARGRRLLRLDCMGENSQLCRYYQEDLGLKPVGTHEGAGWTAKLFEKEIRSDAYQGENRPN
jgi:ribosomal protein S18 acetylase RimI-like enzyme